MSCCELYTHLISTRGLRGGKTKNKKNLLFRPSACWVKQNWIFWQRLAAPSRASVCPWQTEAVLMQVYRLNLCDDVNALEQKTKKTKTKTWNRQSLTVSAPCTRVINCLFVWRSSAARAVKGSNSHKPFPLTNLLHDLSTRGLQTQNDSPSSPWSG